jgi:hypothetical protein
MDMIRDGRFSPTCGYVEACDAWRKGSVFDFMHEWKRALHPPEPIQIVGSSLP